jgi:hypothetical protein
LALGVVALSQSASAQTGEEGTSAEPNLVEEPGPSSEAALEEPALQLKIDSAGVEVVPRAPRTADGYTLEEMDLRVRRARIGLLSTMGVTLLGGVLIGISIPKLDFNTDEGGALFSAGFSVALCGFVGMMTTGGMLAHRKRKRRSLHEAQYERPRRAQWDPAQSRVVF